MPPRKTIVVIGADWDKCAAAFQQQDHSRASLREPVTREDATMMDDYMKDALSHPIQTPNQTSQRVGQPYLKSFSLRAGWWQDELFNASRNGTLSCDNEQGLPEVARKFGLNMETHLLADTLGRLEPGTTHDLLADSCKKRTKEMSQTLKYLTHSSNAKKGEKLYDQLREQWYTTIQQNNTVKPATNTINDPRKGLLLLSTAFFAANIQQEDTTQVHLHIIDDRIDILKPLQLMVENRPDMLPGRLTVAFHRLHPESRNENATAKQIGQAICGTGDHLTDSNINHEDLIRRIAKLSEHVNTKTWVHENQGAIFCQIHDEALKQIKQEALKKTEALKNMEQTLFITPGTSLWRTETGTSTETDNSLQGPNNIDDDIDASMDLMWCDNQIPVSTKYPCNTRIQVQPLAMPQRTLALLFLIQCSKYSAGLFQRDQIKIPKEELIHGKIITDLASPQSCSETLFFDSRQQPIFRWTEDEVVKHFNG